MLATDVNHTPVSNQLAISHEFFFQSCFDGTHGLHWHLHKLKPYCVG